MHLTTPSEFLITLLRQLETVIPDAEFDVAAWLSQWIETPVPALGGARPIDLMNTPEGQALVLMTLSQMWGGAYA